MKKRTAFPLLGLLLAFVLLACSCPVTGLTGIGSYANPTPTLMNCGQTTESDLEAQVVSMINDARAKQGLTPYVVNELLTGAAIRHSTDMACNEYVGNVGTDGATWHELMVQGGYLVKYGGIATTAGYVNDLNGMIEALSGGDYSVITDTDATEIGVGAVSKSGTQYGTYWTILIALPNR
jgi:uncharacterized protein YkwD